MLFSNTFKGLMSGTFSSAVLLLSPSISDAMQIAQYDAMSKDDQSRYVAELVSTSMELLSKQGREEEYKKVAELFKKERPDIPSQGAQELVNKTSNPPRRTRSARSPWTPSRTRLFPLLIFQFANEWCFHREPFRWRNPVPGPVHVVAGSLFQPLVGAALALQMVFPLWREP